MSSIQSLIRVCEVRFMQYLFFKIREAFSSMQLAGECSAWSSPCSQSGYPEDQNSHRFSSPDGSELAALTLGGPTLTRLMKVGRQGEEVGTSNHPALLEVKQAFLFMTRGECQHRSWGALRPGEAVNKSAASAASLSGFSSRDPVVC